MTEYILKSALVEEIDKIKEMYCYDQKTNASFVAEAVISSINNAINSLEVKEVDLEKEIMKYQREIYDRDTTIRDVAKHFFELGLKAAKKGENE